MIKLFILFFSFTCLALHAEFAIGTSYKGFIVTNSVAIPELEGHLTELIHEESGAEVVHIGLPDPENFFTIAFLTPPDSSKGTAHILEHCVLEGSKKYPVPNLFHALTSRSVASFMNAMTTADTNYYPVASYDEQDFYNTLDIYIDAVFNPLLSPLTFKQEGHRVEFQNPNDPSSSLEFKGVVYNEMKGAFSMPYTRLIKSMAAETYRDSAYRFNAGGNPEDILKLKYDEFCDFHKKYYYPGNAILFFSGDIPLQKHLDFLAKQSSLQGPVRARAEPIVQPRYPSVVRKELLYPGQQELLGFSWLLGSSHDAQETVALNLLEIILMGSDASPLKSKLLESGLCKEVQAGLHFYRTAGSYNMVFEGVKAEDCDKIEQLLNTLLSEVEVTDEAIDQAAKLYQLLTSDMAAGGQPFGLTLYQRAVYLKLYGYKIEDMLHTEQQIDAIKKLGPRYFQELIKKYFLNGPHLVRMLFLPSSKLQRQESDAEKRTLSDLRKNLSDDRILSIQQDAQAIATISANDELHLLPRPVMGTVKHIELSKQVHQAINLFHHECFTNHITYVDLMLAVPDMALEELWMLQLFCDLAPELATDTRSYQENLNFIQENSGGISLNLTVQNEKPFIHMRTKGLDSKQEVLFSLLYDVLLKANCSDQKRVKELILKYVATVANSIDHASLKLAMGKSFASTSKSNQLQSYFDGLYYIQKIIDLAAHIDERIGACTDRLAQLQKSLLDTSRIDVVLTCSTEAMESAKNHGIAKLTLLTCDSARAFQQDVSIDQQRSCAFITNSSVADNVRAFTTYDFRHQDAPIIATCAHLLQATCLHKRIREQGGAYGAGAKYSLSSGNFVLFSYRDPNIAKTAAIFEEALTSLSFTDDELEDAKLLAAHQNTKQLAASVRGFSEYFNLQENRSETDRLQYHERVKNVSRDDVYRVINEIILPKFRQSVLITFAGEELINKERKQGILPIHSICKVMSGECS